MTDVRENARALVLAVTTAVQRGLLHYDAEGNLLADAESILRCLAEEGGCTVFEPEPGVAVQARSGAGGEWMEATLVRYFEKQKLYELASNSGAHFFVSAESIRGPR